MIGRRTGQPEATLLPWRADQLTKAILVCKLMKPKQDEKGSVYDGNHDGNVGNQCQARAATDS